MKQNLYSVQIQLTVPWDKYQIEKQCKLLKLEMFLLNLGRLADFSNRYQTGSVNKLYMYVITCVSLV